MSTDRLYGIFFFVVCISAPCREVGDLIGIGHDDGDGLRERMMLVGSFRLWTYSVAAIRDAYYDHGTRRGAHPSRRRTCSSYTSRATAHSLSAQISAPWLASPCCCVQPPPFCRV